MEFIEVLSYLIIYILLPVAGIVGIIYLIVLINNLIYTVKEANLMIYDLKKKAAKLDKPIDSIVRGFESANKVKETILVPFTALGIWSKRKRKKNK